MDEKKSIAKTFYNHLSTTFMFAILAMALTGLVTSDSVEQVGLFVTDAGLSFSGILQLLLWSSVISLLGMVLTSDIWFKKVMLLWRVVVLFFLGIATSIAFATIFQWIPTDSWRAWAGFISFFVIGFGAGLAAILVKVKIKDRRYNKLLSEYKSKREESDYD